MNKNQSTQETEWTLYAVKPCKDYPSRIYVWVNPENIIVHMRSIEPMGYAKPYLFDGFVGKDKSFLRGMGFKKVSNHGMNDEQMSQGWLTHP
jgi:hypothetical protein